MRRYSTAPSISSGLVFSALRIPHAKPQPIPSSTSPASSQAPAAHSCQSPTPRSTAAKTPAASSAVTSKTITSRLRIWLCRVCLFRAAYKRASQRGVSGYFRISSAGDGVCASSWSISARYAISRAASKKIFVSFVIFDFIRVNFYSGSRY